MNIPEQPRPNRQRAYTLITTLVLTAVTTMALAATLARTYTVANLNNRENYYVMANTAAEAATEKVLSEMMVDFANGGNSTLSNNITRYRTGLLPNSTESSYWTNFQFSDAQGNSNAIYVACTTTNPNPPYVALEQQYPGLNAFALNYRIIANAAFTNSSYNFIGACQQDVQMAEIPVFQFAIFYNGVLEFSDCAPMTVNGRVQCNSNIDVGTVSGSSLTFNYIVTASGTISNPPMAGYTQSQWTAPITYNGTPSPGYGTGEPVLSLPIGTNSASASAVQQIIIPPPPGEATTNPISPLRYWNEADMTILVTNPVLATSTNAVTSTNYSVWIQIKGSMYDSSPTNIFLGTNINNGTNVNWANTGVSNWLSTNLTFYDQRQGRTNQVTQIDVGKLGQWIGYSGGAATNRYCSNKWAGGPHFNGIIYVLDARNTNAMYINCVRLFDGQTITNGFAGYGLTVATENPLYVMGNYNCPNAAYLNTTNTTGTMPCSFVCDAITILSPNWQADGYDSLALSGPGVSYSLRPAASDTVNAAMIAGNVPSTGSSSTTFSGGVHNLTRLLENWSGQTLTLNTSIIQLYPSAQATAQFQMPTAYYSPPTRQFSFNLNYENSAGLPPGTPLVYRMIRANWCNPPPNTTTYAYTNDFVAF